MSPSLPLIAALLGLGLVATMPVDATASEPRARPAPSAGAAASAPARREAAAAGAPTGRSWSPAQDPNGGGGWGITNGREVDNAQYIPMNSERAARRAARKLNDAFEDGQARQQDDGSSKGGGRKRDGAQGGGKDSVMDSGDGHCGPGSRSLC